MSANYQHQHQHQHQHLPFSPSAASPSSSPSPSSPPPSSASPSAPHHYQHPHHPYYANQATPSSPLTANSSTRFSVSDRGTPPPSASQDSAFPTSASASASASASSSSASSSAYSPATTAAAPAPLPGASGPGSANPITNNSNSSTNDLREWYRRERAGSSAGLSSAAAIITTPPTTHQPPSTPSTNTTPSSSAAALPASASASTAASPNAASGAAGTSSSSLSVSSPFSVKRRDRESRTASESKARRPSSVFDLAGSMLDRFKGKMATGHSHHARGESSSSSSSRPATSALSIAVQDPFAVQEDSSPVGPDSPSVAGSNQSVHSVRHDRLSEPEVVEMLHSPTSPHPSHNPRKYTGNNERSSSQSSSTAHYSDTTEHDRDRHAPANLSREGTPSGSRAAAGMRRTSSAYERVYIQVTDDNERFAVVDISGLSSARAIKELMFRKLRLFDPEDPHADRDAFQVYRTEIGVEEGKQATQPYIDDDSLLALCLQFGDDRGSLKFLVKPLRPPSAAHRSSAGNASAASVVASPHQVSQQIWDREHRSSSGSGGNQQQQQQQSSHRSNASSISSINENNPSGLHRSRAQVKRHAHSTSTSTDDSFGLSPVSTPGSSSLPYVQQGRHGSISEASPRTEHSLHYHGHGGSGTPPPRAGLSRGGSDGPYDASSGQRANGYAQQQHQQHQQGLDDGRPHTARSSSFSTQNSMSAQAARDAVLSNPPSRSQSATVASASSGPGPGQKPFPQAPQTPSPSRELGQMMYDPAHTMQSSQSAHTLSHHQPQQQQQQQQQQHPPPLNRNTSQPGMSTGYPAWSNGMPPHSVSQPSSVVTSPQVGSMPNHAQQNFGGVLHSHPQGPQQHPAGLRPANGITIHSTKSMDDIRMRMPPQMPPPGTMPMPIPAGGTQQPRPPPPPGPYAHAPTGPDGRPLAYPLVSVTRPPPSVGTAALAPFDPRMGPSPAPSPQMRAWTPQSGSLPGAVLPPFHPSDPRFRSPSVGAAHRVSHYDPRYPHPPTPGQQGGYAVPPPPLQQQQQQQQQQRHPMVPPPLPGQMVIPPQRPMSAVPMPPYSSRPPPLPPQGSYGGAPPPMHHPMSRPGTSMSSASAGGGPGPPPPQYTSEFGGRVYAPEMRPNVNPAMFPSRPHTYHDGPQVQHPHQQTHGGAGGYRPMVPGPGSVPTASPAPLVVREDPFTSAAFPNSSLRQVTQFQVAPTKLQPGMTVQQSLQARNGPQQQQQQPQQGSGGVAGVGAGGNSSGGAGTGGSRTPAPPTPSSAGSGSTGSTPIWATINDHDDPYHRADAVVRLTHEAQQQRQHQQAQQHRPAVPPVSTPRHSGASASASSPTDVRSPASPGMYSPTVSHMPALRVSNPSSTTPQTPLAPLPLVPLDAAAAHAHSVTFVPERSSGSSFASASAGSSSSHARIFSSGGGDDRLSRYSAEEEEDGEGHTSSSAPTSASARSSRSGEAVFSPTSAASGSAATASAGGGGSGNTRAGSASSSVDRGEAGYPQKKGMHEMGKQLPSSPKIGAGGRKMGSRPSTGSGGKAFAEQQQPSTPLSAAAASAPPLSAGATAGLGSPRFVPSALESSSKHPYLHHRAADGSTLLHGDDDDAGGSVTIRPDLLLGAVPAKPEPKERASADDEDEDTLKAEKWESLRSVLTPAEAQSARAREMRFQEATAADASAAAAAAAAAAVASPNTVVPPSTPGGLGLSTGERDKANADAKADPDANGDRPPPVPEKVRTGMSPGSPPFARPRFQEETGAAAASAAAAAKFGSGAADDGGGTGTFASFASFDDDDDEVGTWAQPLDPAAKTAVGASSSSSASAPATVLPPSALAAAAAAAASSGAGNSGTITMGKLGAGMGGLTLSIPPAASGVSAFDAKGVGEGTIQPVRVGSNEGTAGTGTGTGTGTASPRPPKLRIQTVPTIVQPSSPRTDRSRDELSTSPLNEEDDEGDDDEEEDGPKSSAVSSSLGRSQSFAKHGNDWALRPPPEELYDNLDDFFPKHDLDRPVVEATAIPGSPLVGSPKSDGSGLGVGGSSSSGGAAAGGSTSHHHGSGQAHAHQQPPLSPFPHRSRHKRSIRIAAEDGKKVMERKLQARERERVGGVVGVPGVSGGLARRASTKLWGSKVVEMTPGGHQEPLSAVSAASGEGEGSDHKRLFKWVKGDLIGKGTYGRVYLALNVTTGEMIAVKQVELPRTDSDRDNVRQKGVVNALKAEIQTLQDLDHPHIVSYLGFEETDTHLSIFLEYVPGGSVGSCIRKYGKFEEPVVSFFLHQILEGLAYLHDKRILHRDLKADNILVDWDGICKISDFGTVRKTDDIYNNQEMSLQGSIFWMAPEVINMTADGYSAKVDIWSLGCVVLEMLAGRRPWSEQEAVQAMLRIGSKKQTPPIPNDVKLSIQAQHFLDNTFEIDPTTRPTALKLLTHVFCYVPPQFHFEESSLHAAMSRARRLT
ncbi:mitogen-activated protein kinase kinase kinase [Tilletia horrida]|nr:mitogen-activated protein kinase kinase kinase [Tilletia horrida]